MRVAADDLEIVTTVLARFGRHLEEALFAAGGPDGALDSVPVLLGEAAAMGLLADGSAGGAGYETGVWGRHVLDAGSRLSLFALASLAEVCAGVATAVHAQGLGCLALDGAPLCPERAVVGAAFAPSYGLALDPRTAGDGLRLRASGSGFVLDGTAHFVLSAGRPDWLACFAEIDDGGWAALAIPVDAAGTTTSPVGVRAGLRAASERHVACEAVQVAATRVLHQGRTAHQLLRRTVACDWLGQAAIALGTARRAALDARAYAAGRYQGGRTIVGHPAVGLLLARADHDVALLEAVVERHADVALASMPTADLLRWAVTARLAAAEHAHRAVTDSLQVLGGYGYMDDYGLSKRLRDVTTLASLHGGSDQLLLFLHELCATGGDV